MIFVGEKYRKVCAKCTQGHGCPLSNSHFTHEKLFPFYTFDKSPTASCFPKSRTVNAGKEGKRVRKFVFMRPYADDKFNVNIFRPSKFNINKIYIV